MTSARYRLSDGTFRQDWSNANLITANNDWSQVASIMGYRGDDVVTSTGVDPRTIIGANTSEVVLNVVANQTNPSASNLSGGVIEFDTLADRTIGLNGSGTADAPSIVAYFDATGVENIRFQCNIRDLDSSADNAVQQVAIQCRVGGGAWTNIGYFGDVTTAGSATQVTAVDLILPALANNASDVQVRVITTNAAGNDETIGIDDIVVSSQTLAADTTAPTLAAFNPSDPDDNAVAVDPAGNIVLRFSEAVQAGSGSFTLSNGGSDIRVFDITNPQVTISGNTVTIDPATNLLAATKYTLTAPAGIVKDAAGNSFAGLPEGALDFTTEGLLTLKIGDIQGLGHTSTYVGAHVLTRGVVTAIDSNGFYLQSAAGQTDGDARTSDGILVFTGAAPSGIAVGDLLEVDARVTEFLAGNDNRNLTITELTSPVIAKLGQGTIEATVIGEGGIHPPTSVIENDGFTSYDPATDGIDFYESLEGMFVTIDAPIAISNTNEFGETYVVASGGVGSTGQSARGGLTLSAGDYNPERLQIDDDTGLFTGFQANYTIGDRLSDVSGVMSYAFQSYELLVTAPVSVTEDVTLWRDYASIYEADDKLSVATYNMENFSASDDPAKIYSLASDILFNLNAPDIIAAQEIQDANGAEAGGSLSGVATAQSLIDAMMEFGGPQYAYVEIAPTANNSTGGEPNGNIRNGYFYDPSRVSLVDGSLQLINDPIFNGTRKPLAATFSFNGEEVTLVNVHSTSRLGSDGLCGATQPPSDAGDAARTAQSQAVKIWINGELAADPSAKIAVLGDFNGFSWEGGVTALTASGQLKDLNNLIAPEERYSYIFDGNLQQIDHIVATNNLYQVAEFQPVHLNAEQTPDLQLSTDHDPLLAVFQLGGSAVPAFQTVAFDAAYAEAPIMARQFIYSDQWFAIA
ncbi:endonuclease/exonuclease/phosphatase [Sphingomonas sp. ID1715]|uniref:Ig-like domain-containing protein n=1 Tax=Sphingomonas sp. ID1715 TaxID=1656898 RepID=UPI001488090F|nr:Ig-like domain-containing protein [Sphingomonas sp. ID1715]NNM75819.1 endonuclease/exonuclease/phosphatase [Sphingomonas sp. ID1715]